MLDSQTAQAILQIANDWYDDAALMSRSATWWSLPAKAGSVTGRCSCHSGRIASVRLG
jgi:hypothetical protein